MKNKCKEPKPRTKVAEDSMPRKQKPLIEMLVSAERAGMIRWVLQGAGDAFRKLDAEAGSKYSSDAARRAREGRSAVAGYLHSILGSFDARTKADILIMLIVELWHSTKHPTATDEPGMERTGDYDGSAVMGILGAMRLVSHLCRHLAKEDGCLAEELPLYVSDLVETVNEIAERDPKLVRSIAAERIDWPIMATRHYPKASDLEKLTDRIGLASKSVVKPAKRHTWKPDTAINRHILDMLVVETYGDGRALTKGSVTYYLDEVLMPLFEDWAKERGGWENYPEFSEIARSAAKRGKAGVQRSEVRNRVKKALEALAN